MAHGAYSMVHGEHSIRAPEHGAPEHQSIRARGTRASEHQSMGHQSISAPAHGAPEHGAPEHQSIRASEHQSMEHQSMVPGAGRMLEMLHARLASVRARCCSCMPQPVYVVLCCQHDTAAWHQRDNSAESKVHSLSLCNLHCNQAIAAALQTDSAYCQKHTTNSTLDTVALHYLHH
jgi:hypothetical protein